MTVKFDDLLPRLLDAKYKVAAVDLRALTALTPAQVRALKPVWPQIAVSQRRRLAQLMAELAEENIELDYNDVFKIALRDADEEVRRMAVQGLWEDEELSTAIALVTALRSDPAPAVRAAAAISLSHFVYLIEIEELEEKTGRQVQEALFSIIDNTAEPIEVRRRAVEAIGYLSGDRTKDIITRAYADANAKMRVSAIFAMGRNANDRWVPTVLQELNNSSAEFRFEAVRAAGELDDSRAVPQLIQLLEDADREVRMAATTSLGKIGGNAAKQALTAATQGRDQELAAAAAEALEEIEIFTDPLKFRLTDSDE